MNTLWGKFQALPISLKIILGIVLFLAALGLSPLVSALALPIIGYAVAHKSWREMRRSKDKIVYVVLAAAATAIIGLLILFRNPTFQTDWEGGNPIDNLIMVLMLTLMLMLATVWALFGWALQRQIKRIKK
ncbi:MAG: hypothetical protein RL149_467 [Actinomycetota bacterium]|jgi:peptidoglycan biosynthesis protein MviN/MurJ (putative lipid II flippase)